MRRRMIDPDFWKDDKLAVFKMTARLVFIASWSYADDYGYYEENYKKMRAVMFPYDTDFDIEEPMARLIEHGFIEVYEVTGVRYHHIKNFLKYQKLNRPTPSKIMPLIGDSIALTESSLNPHGALIPEVKIREVKISKDKTNIRDWFSLVWSKYPNKQGKDKAIKSFHASVTSEVDFADIQTALANYLSCEKVAKGFIQNGSTWFRDWKPWVAPTPQMIGKITTGTTNEPKGADHPFWKDTEAK